MARDRTGTAPRGWPSRAGGMWAGGSQGRVCTAARPPPDPPLPAGRAAGGAPSRGPGVSGALSCLPELHPVHPSVCLRPADVDGQPVDIRLRLLQRRPHRQVLQAVRPAEGAGAGGEAPQGPLGCASWPPGVADPRAAPPFSGRSFVRCGGDPGRGPKRPSGHTGGCSFPSRHSVSFRI